MAARMHDDGPNKRIAKAVTHCADRHARFHDYDDGQRFIETPDGSDVPRRQCVRDLGSIDELIQMGILRARSPISKRGEPK